MSSAEANTNAASAAQQNSNAEDSKQSAQQQQDGEFVNEGLRLWESSRTEWLGHAQRSSESDSTARPAAVPIEVDEIIEVVFAMPRQTASDEAPPKFPRTVPLPQMVDILVDLWEAEGLDI